MKDEFLDFLELEFNNYHSIPLELEQEKKSKKEFINGLMKASRFFDVTFDELQAIVKKSSVQEKYVKNATDFLDIPTFIRLGKQSL